MNETWQMRAKRAMKHRRLSQERLAETLGMTQGGLGHWLSDARQPSLGDINRIADAIGVSAAWLTHGLGFESGAGKPLLEILLAGALSESQLAALLATATAFAKMESIEGKVSSFDLQKILEAQGLMTTDQIMKQREDAK
jgi:transcriptional regulator with XRE-family HTH domain